MAEDMKRGSFIKSLFALAVAPKSIALKMTETPLVTTVAEVTTASKYIAGYMKVSKQLMANLPFLQSTLPKMLMRDFYKGEESEFENYIKQIGNE